MSRSRFIPVLTMSDRQRPVGWNLEVFCAVPAGLIEDQDRVCAGGYSCGDLIEMKLHGFGVTERENESSAGSVLWAYRTEQIG